MKIRLNNKQNTKWFSAKLHTHTWNFFNFWNGQMDSFLSKYFQFDVMNFKNV